MSETNGVKIPEGHIGNLTLVEERKLQEAWTRLFAIFGVADAEAPEAKVGKKTNVANNDKWGQNEEYRKYLENVPAEEIRKSFWVMLKADSPDSMVLRFLRARKWDVDLAIVMLISNVQWRTERNIEENIVKKGEAVWLKEDRTKDENDFVNQYRLGKSYVRGLDREGRVVYIVKPKLHDPHKQSSECMEMYILHTIESIRNLVRDPYDTACLIFDMTGFSIRNMDYATVKFIVQVFEARYPETLGMVCVHNAPFIFSAIWRIVNPWLDPVVASKIHFTRKGKDLEPHIAPESLQTEYGGEDPYVYSYIEPRPGENDKMADHETREKIIEDRMNIADAYEKATRTWADLDPETPEAKEAAAKRAELTEELRLNYWRLDPYVRSRNFYDRAGILDDTGKVNFKSAA